MTATRATIYSEPTRRPCERIEPEATAGIQVGLEESFAALTEPLALKGVQGMVINDEGKWLVAEHLRETMPWMEPAITALERHVRISVWAGRPWLSWTPFCLVGDPGSGKSHFARELATRSGLSFAALDLAAMHDAGALVAVSRGWTNTKPCWPAQMMAAFGTANPLLVLDELDKAGGSERHGEPHKALLAMLEPSTAAHYFDTCLMTEIDLSAICWIATANSTAALPQALKSRLEVVEIPLPAPEDFEVALRGILDGFAAKWEVPDSDFPVLPGEAKRVLRDAFARYRSVRLLKRQLAAVIAAIIPEQRRTLH